MVISRGSGKNLEKGMVGYLNKKEIRLKKCLSNSETLSFFPRLSAIVKIHGALSLV